VAVKNDRSQVVLVSPEIPLVQLGGINLGKFAEISNPESDAIYSWVFNNYWTTNFRASQEGELKWTYRLTSSKDTSNVFSTKFGWDERVPMPARVFPARGKDTLAYGKMLMRLNENFLLVSARPSNDKQGIILQVREIAGQKGHISWDDPESHLLDLRTYTQARFAFEVSVLEEKIAAITNRIEFKPYESKFIKIVF
jgi:alpha-mannosidase